jgi:hypothetical protein
LLHDNAGKATRRFPPNFSTIPQKLCLACLSKIYHAFWQRQQNQILKNQVDGSPTNAGFTCAGAVDHHLCHSPSSKATEASRQRQVEAMLGGLQLKLQFRII